MKVTPIVVISLEITEVPGLDPIRVLLQDLGPNQGRLIIECYGQAWSCSWMAMGSDIRSFVTSVDPDYIASKLAGNSARKLAKKDISYLLRVVKAVREALRLYL